MYSSSSEDDLPYVNVARNKPIVCASTRDEPIVLQDSPTSSPRPSKQFDHSHHYAAAGSSCESSLVILAKEDGGRSPVVQFESSVGRVERNREMALEKRRTKEDLKEKLTQERNRERHRKGKERKRRKEMDAAVKEVLKKNSAESRSGERMKQMVVVMDTTLFEKGDFMAQFEKGVRALEVDYRVSEDVEAGTVRWLRVVRERTVDERARIVEEEREEEEHELLVTLEAQGFVGLVHHSKEVGPMECCSWDHVVSYTVGGFWLSYQDQPLMASNPIYPPSMVSNSSYPRTGTLPKNWNYY